MKVLTTWSGACALCTTLAACGGGSTGGHGGDPVQLAPANFLVGGEQVVFNTTTDVLVANGTRISGAADARVNDVINPARVTSDQFGNFLTARANRGETFAFYYVEDTGTGSRHGGIYGRRDAYELVPSGNVSVEGKYAGMLVSNLGTFQQQDVQRIVLGDVDMEVQLSDMRISGNITDRQSQVVGNAARTDVLRDVSIMTAPITSGGGFNATATAPPSSLRVNNTSNVFVTTTAEAGTVRGAIGGRTGSAPDVAGLLSLSHTTQTGLTLFEERGAFYAE